MEKKTTITAPEGHYIDLENSKIVYKPIERELPKTWGDYCILTMTTYYKNLPMYDKLIKLRDYYNNGHVFDWCENPYELKYVIIFRYDGKTLEIDTLRYRKYSPFYFKSCHLANEFINNFKKELIEYFKNL